MARIMVVEDDVYMREELTDLLRKSGYETASLFDFENAIPEITEYSPDLVLLDINLPFHSGFEICKELKAKQLGTVLVLTARDKLQDELHALGFCLMSPVFDSADFLVNHFLEAFFFLLGQSFYYNFKCLLLVFLNPNHRRFCSHAYL